LRRRSRGEGVADRSRRKFGAFFEPFRQYVGGGADVAYLALNPEPLLRPGHGHAVGCTRHARRLSSSALLGEPSPLLSDTAKRRLVASESLRDPEALRPGAPRLLAAGCGEVAICRAFRVRLCVGIRRLVAGGP
jgi:hypothetical protein